MAGVALNSAPTEGVLISPPSQIKSTFPVLKNPANRANFQPGHQDAWVDYHNDRRAPLLFLSGGEDHLMPPSVQRSNAKHYKSDAVTEIKEYPRYAHLLPAQEGWEDIADYALGWAVAHANGGQAKA